MAGVTRPIATYLIDYGRWLLKHHPGPEWSTKDAVRRNLELWKREYGEAVATQVRDALLKEWKGTQSA